MLRLLAALLLANLGTSYSQPTYDPSLVLARARDRILELTERLPKYTCIQTINRSYFSSEKKPQAGDVCDQMAGDSQRGRRKLKLEATDRLRLDVIVTGGHEIYSWASASQFDSRLLGDFPTDGPIGTGPFGTFLLDIFQNDGVSFSFLEATQLRAKTALRYEYEVPREASHYLLRTQDRNWRATAFRGSLWMDPVAYELERLTVLTSELPPDSAACTADTRVDYQRVRLGSGDFLLPLESELHFVLRDSTESTSVSGYAKCREYSAESKLSFDESSTSKPEPVPSPVPLPVPDSLPVVLVLEKPIETATAAAGDSISARVKGAVLDSKSHAIVIPAGAIVHGRIVRMEHRLVPQPHFLISLVWATIEVQATLSPFYATLDQHSYEQAQAEAHFKNKRVTVWLPPPGESKRAGGWLILPTSKDRYVVPAGYTTQWLTGSVTQ